MAWQPIETAPKDGSVFLAWTAETADYWPGPVICRITQGGRFRIDSPREVGALTHWMPLPDPPANS